jgi:transposase
VEGHELARGAEGMDRDELLREFKRIVELLIRQQAEIEALKKENERLRQGRGHTKGKVRRSQARAAATGVGPHRRRGAPHPSGNERTIEVTCTEICCPHCGGDLDEGTWEQASTTDIPKAPPPEVTHFNVQARTCKRCGRKVRGRHPELAPDQQGATAHRLGDRVMAVAQTLHYGFGVTQRKVPTILKELTGIEVTQGALSQDASRRACHLEPEYQRLRERIQKTAVVHTDDTGWRVGGQRAQMMVFTTEQGDTLYQIRMQHRNQEVREVLPSNWAGTMVTDRGRSYDASQFAGVKQHKCSFHVLGSLQKALDEKHGQARWFGLKLKELTQSGISLWNSWREAELNDDAYRHKADQLQAQIDWHLRDRKLADPDNDRLLRELGKHNDRGNLYRFLQDPSVPTTNNLAERELRPAVVARKVSQCSKTWTGAHNREVLQSIVRSEARKQPPSLIEAVHQKFHDARKCAERLLGFNLDST